MMVNMVTVVEVEELSGGRRVRTRFTLRKPVPLDGVLERI
jgi:hypothetical protein